MRPFLCMINCKEECKLAYKGEKKEVFMRESRFLEGQNKTFESLPAKNQGLSFQHLESALKSNMGIKALTEDILISLELYKADIGYNQAGELLADKNAFSGVDVARFGDSINIILDRETGLSTVN